MHEDEMFDLEEVIEIDSLIMREIVLDIINGTLLVEADTETLEMVLTNIWEMRESYIHAGVIVGNA
jgi:chorismate-pyruvate lyase